jgi:aminocarboxymuconate-semialdehyde decarboxylase
MPALIDVHSHIYPRSYMAHLAARTTVPQIKQHDGQELFVIFEGEAGRPMGPDYWDMGEKLAYMDRHGITQTVLSLGNPWLDDFDGPDGVQIARELNEEFASYQADTRGRVVGMGCLPGTSITDAVEMAAEIAGTPTLYGVVSGTRICGRTLDDPDLDPLWQVLSARRIPLLLHPHYGLGLSEMDGFGHALPLALAFPFETTTALARLVMSGVLARFPELVVIGSHGGGALPFLAGRLDGCWRPDEVAKKFCPDEPSSYISKLYLDAVVYHPRALRATAEMVGEDHIFFGTDHPFSIADAQANVDAIAGTFNGEAQVRVMSQSATDLFGLPSPS